MREYTCQVESFAIFCDAAGQDASILSRYPKTLNPPKLISYLLADVLSSSRVVRRAVQDLVEPLMSHLNGKLSDADRQYLEKAFSLFQSRLLYGPVAALSEDSRTGGRADLTLLEALRKLFRLPE